MKEKSAGADEPTEGQNTPATKRLQGIQQALAAGTHVAPVSVREFLHWFGTKRRGYWKVREINETLERVGVRTLPPFEEVWIDGEIAIVPSSRGPETEVTPKGLVVTLDEPDADPPAEDVNAWTRRDPAFLLSRFAAAHKPIVAVNANDAIARAITLMMSHDFSQLPVMQGDRTVTGIVSWKRIAWLLSQGKNLSTVAEFQVDHYELKESDSLFEALPIIARHGHVLVRRRDRTYSGLLTASDLSEVFLTLSEPFLLLNDIEISLRNLIGSRYTSAELANAMDRPPQKGLQVTADNLSFGEYQRLLEEPSRWKKLGNSIDRVEFCRRLNDVREIRNDVMHFDPEQLKEGALSILRSFAAFIKDVEAISVVDCS